MYKLAVGVIAASMALAACGGSSKPSASGGATTTTGKSGGGSGTTAAGGSGATDLGKTKVKVTYTSTDIDDSGNATTTTLTIALDGNGKSAFTSVEGNDPTSAGTIYNDGTSTVECQGAGTAAKCTEVPATGSTTAATLTQSFAAIATLAATLRGGDKSSTNIAGRDASCTKFKAADVVTELSKLALFKDSSDKPSDYDPSDTANICVDKQSGWVLRIDSMKKGKSEGGLLATSYGDPTDADFTPPVPPETTPTAPNVSIPNVSVPNVSIPPAPTNPGQ